MAQEQEQQQEQLASILDEMKIGNEYNDELKKMMIMIKKMDRPSYGLAEDELFTAPFQCKREYVDRVQLQRKKEIDTIHKEIAKVKMLFLKLKRDIEDNQKTTYRLAVLKKRNIKYEDNEKSRKRQKKEQTDENNIRRAEMSLVETESLASLSATLNNDDDEDDMIDFR